MHFAVPRKDGLGGILFVVERERGILLAEPRHGRRQLHLVLALAWPQRDRIDWLWSLQSGERGPAALGGGQRIACLDRVELAQRDRVAEIGRADLRLLLAEQPVETRDAGAAAVGEPKLAAIGDRAGQDARHRQLAAMSGVDGLHHLQHRAAFVADAKPFARRSHVGRVVADGLEQPQDAVAVFGRADQHRGHDAGAQVRGEIVEHFVERRFDLFQQLFHQQVVMVGERFEHGEAGLEFARLLFARDLSDLALGVFAVDVGTLQGQIDRTDDDAVLAQRNLAQQQPRRARRLQQFQRIAHAHRGLVDLVEE